MPRTTVLIEDDAIEFAKAYAARHRMTLGRAISELVRQSAERPLMTDSRSGLRVVQLSKRSPRVTTELVDQLREDVP